LSALEDVKIIDFTWVVAGPMVTKFLTDYGATVIKVETRQRPDRLRVNTPYKDNIPGLNRSGYFAFFNANKYSISLNLNHPQAREIARKLIIWAGTTVDNFTPGSLERWGLGYKDLIKERPDLIMLSISAQGQTGRYAQHVAFGTQLSGLAGFTEITGWPDREPAQPYGAYTDYIGPYFAAAILLASLDYRRRTGKGVYIDVSQFEASLHFLSPILLDYFVNGRVCPRMGNSHDYAAPHGVYRCRGDDRWCAISVMNDTQWQALCKIMEAHRLTWPKEEKFSTLLGRKENEPELNCFIERWTVEHTAEEVMTCLQKAGIPASVVETAQDLLNDPQLKARNHFWHLAHPEIGAFSHLGQAAKLSKTPAKGVRPAPCLGEHTEFICRKILGITDADFISMLSEGVFD